MLFITLFKIIIVIGSSTLPSAFFMGGSGFATKRGTGRALPFMPNFFNPSLLLDVIPHQQTECFLFLHALPCPSLDWRLHIGKKIFNSF